MRNQSSDKSMRATSVWAGTLKMLSGLDWRLRLKITPGSSANAGSKAVVAG
jgi:hypothetical protein